jgi:hypothetical protein
MTTQPFLALASALLVYLGLNLPRPALAGSVEMTIEAVLVWGTNSEKPPGKNLKDLEFQLAHKLSKGPYKWKNYFEVNRKRIIVPANSSKHLPMSEHCELDLKNLGEDRLEVRLIGRGKPVSRNVESLPLGHTMVLSGDDKNDNAWLIVLRQMPPKN